MSPSREEYARLRELFERAVELPIEERRALAAAETDGNPGLRRRLEAMLDEDAAGGLGPKLIGGRHSNFPSVSRRAGGRWRSSARRGSA